MDLKDLEQQLNNGVIISKVQWLRVLEFALKQQAELEKLQSN